MKSYTSARHERFLYLIIWSVVALLPVALELWEVLYGTGFKWVPITRWWVGMIPLILLFLLHNSILIPKLMKKGHMKAYGLTILIILFVYAFYQYMLPSPDFDMFIPPAGEHPVPMMPDMPPRHFPILFKMMFVIMTLGINAVISLTFTYTREQENLKELENNRLQEELKYLKQQISPHFLMNVLNNIHEMAEENTKEAQNMILELSYLMRYVLYESENDMTTLAAESKFISSYVALMKIRYVEGIVKVNLDIPEQMPKDIHIPPLLFISFIENAFKHGISYNHETTIDISLDTSDDNVRFTCRNTVPPKQESTVQGGVGLTNVCRRLELLYGENYSLDLNHHDDNYSVTLIIPCR